ncbi:hypothetical protein PQ610_06650 [Tardisphaera miroshnichenkoae]
MNHALKDREARVAHSALFSAPKGALDRFVETGDKSALPVQSGQVPTWEASNYEALGRVFYEVLASVNGERELSEAVKKPPEGARAAFEKYGDQVKKLVDKARLYSEAKREIEKLKGELEANLEELKELQEKLDRAAEDMKKEKTKESDLISANKELKGQVQELRQELNAAQEKLEAIAGLQAQLDQANAQLKDAREWNAVFKIALENRLHELSEANRKLEKDDEEISKLRGDLDLEKAKATGYEAEVRYLSDERARLSISAEEGGKPKALDPVDVLASSLDARGAVAETLERGEKFAWKAAELEEERRKAVEDRGEKFAWKVGQLQERAMSAELKVDSSIEASARLWYSLSAFADQKDAMGLLDGANGAVKGNPR